MITNRLSTFPSSSTARSSQTGWISVHDTTATGSYLGNAVKLPISANDAISVQDRTIDWGDGTIEVRNEAEPSHTYENSGVYIVTMFGGNTSSLGSAVEILEWTHTVTDVQRWGTWLVGETPGWTDFSSAFENCIRLMSVPNELPLTVTTLNSMFKDATVFNQDISSWDTSNVTDMGSMFFNAISFNQDIWTWIVKNVTNMTSMFDNAVSFNQDLSRWTVDLIPTQPVDFDTGATSWTLPRPSWGAETITLYPMSNTGAIPGISLDWLSGEGALVGAVYFRGIGIVTKRTIRSFENLFDSVNDPDIATWNTSFVTNMKGTFSNATSFNQDISSWDTSNVTDMSHMFLDASSFNQPLNNWDTSNVTTMARMFENASEFNQPLDNWNTSLVTDMLGMFREATQFDQDLSTWNVSLIPTKPVEFDLNATSWTSNIKKPFWGYNGVSEFKTVASYYPLTNTSTNPLSVSNEELFFFPLEGIYKETPITDASSFFANNSTFNDPDIVLWNVSTFEAAEAMFLNASQFNQDLSGWCAWQFDDAPLDFDTGANNWSLPRPIWGDMRVCPIPSQIVYYPLTNTSNDPTNSVWRDRNPDYQFYPNDGIYYAGPITDMGDMFSNNNTFNDPDISNWDTSTVTNMERMFRDATSFNQPLNNWNTSNVVFMSNLFQNATEFNQDISSWDTSNVERLQSVFNNASSFNQPLNTWDTSNVRFMFSLFAGASSFNQPLNNWNTSNVQDMRFLFREATAFNGDISTWDVSNITSMDSMFAFASSFNQDISSWITSNVISMEGTFFGASQFNQDISNWNTSLVTNMEATFRSASSFNQDLSTWCVEQIPNEPTDFDTGATSWTLPRPNWGDPC